MNRAPAYPYAEIALRPAWSDRRAQLLALAPVTSMIAALLARWPIGLAEADDLALRVILPAALGFILAFAPAPRTAVGGIARVLTVLSLAGAVFAGDYLPVMLACYPLTLMLSVVLARERDVSATYEGEP